MRILDYLAAQNRMARPARAAGATTAYLVGDVVNGRATVQVYGSDPIAGVPAVAADYVGTKTVHVLVDSRGRPDQVTGPTSLPVPEPEPPPTPEPEEPNEPAADPEPEFVSRSRVVRATFTGTWKVNSPSGFGKWGGSTEGFPNSAAQDSDAGSGPLIGVAVYGGQVPGLGASSITRMRVTLVNASTYQTFTPVLRGIPNNAKPGSQPNPTGASVTGPSLAPGERVTVDLPQSMREAFRTGTLGGLALVGGTDGWVRGTDHPTSLSIAVTYFVQE